MEGRGISCDARVWRTVSFDVENRNVPPSMLAKAAAMLASIETMSLDEIENEPTVQENDTTYIDFREGAAPYPQILLLIKGNLHQRRVHICSIRLCPEQVVVLQQ